MFENGKEDLLEYVFRFMISKDLCFKFLTQHGINIKENMSSKKIAESLRNERGFEISVFQVREFTRGIWKSANIDGHLRDLKSGLLKGHSWHGAMPSFLHLSFQKKVREYCQGSLTLKEYLEIGKDISKQEFYIVVTHDICESKIIESFPEVIPSIANKGVSDFIFDGIPYDLKNSGVPEDWTFEKAKNNKREFAASLYKGADKARLRKQAEKSINNWGLNRFYIILKEPDNWLNNPERVIKRLVEECGKLQEPINFEVDGLSIMCRIIFIE